MTEKQTFAPESDETELISQDDLDMVNGRGDWEDTSAAARRAVDLSTPREAAPVPPTVETEPPKRRKITGKQALGWGVAGVAMTVGVVGIASQADGDNNAERGELQPAITSITVSPDANWRLDPTVPDEYTAPNVAFDLDAEVKIDALHDIRVLEGTNNGTWYGINLEDIAAKVPDVANTSDEDHIIWVNEQGVVSVQTDQQLASPTE